jgi:predicted metal-dependent phosphoesterase TrpH
MLADLHLHSLHSDGVLAVEALVAHVASRGVQQLALTDHDTVAGCAAAQAACAARELRFVPGVELTCLWRGQELHVLGLGIDPDDPALATQLHELLGRRRERLREIGARLERRGKLPGRELAERCLQHEVPTRQHLARELVAQGHARDVAEAFELWLGRNGPGHVPASWPALAASVAVLRAAGGIAVLAHPHRYKISAGALRALLGEFREAGGEGMEVSVGGMSRNDLDRLATLARRFALAASAGSDFHDPAVPWNPPGGFAKLPADLDQVAARL